jgi:branched-subunit amino acid permease
MLCCKFLLFHYLLCRIYIIRRKNVLRVIKPKLINLLVCSGLQKVMSWAQVTYRLQMCMGACLIVLRSFLVSEIFHSRKNFHNLLPFRLLVCGSINRKLQVASLMALWAENSIKNIFSLAPQYFSRDILPTTERKIPPLI